MEPPRYHRKFEELERSLNRLRNLYNGKIINEEGEDSFQSPKDILLGFFRVTYELKEALKKDNYCISNNIKVEDLWEIKPLLALGLDITNQEKHVILNNSKSGKKIGQINTHLHILSPDGKDRTELTIEIDGIKQDSLQLAIAIFEDWKTYLKNNQLID